MSRQVWEYASVVFTDTQRKITKQDPEFERLSPSYARRGELEGWAYYWWREWTYWIWLPGATEADRRDAWESDFDEQATNALEIYNELGAEGWELVSIVVRGSKVGESRGWATASEPIMQTATLKRVREAD